MKETTAIRAVARLAPWLAPLPAAYFIGRASYLHLFPVEPWGLRLAVALIIGLVVEMVSLAAFHTRLDLDRWNRMVADKNRRRKVGRKVEKAPTAVVNAAIVVYLLGVFLLLFVLEAFSEATRWAPLFFPLLGVAGVLVLATIGQHEDRKQRYGVDDSLKQRTRPRQITATIKALEQPTTPTVQATACKYICPLCNDGFNDQHEYAGHMSGHTRARLRGSNGHERITVQEAQDVS